MSKNSKAQNNLLNVVESTSQDLKKFIDFKNNQDKKMNDVLSGLIRQKQTQEEELKESELAYFNEFKSKFTATPKNKRKELITSSYAEMVLLLTEAEINGNVHATKECRSIQSLLNEFEKLIDSLDFVPEASVSIKSPDENIKTDSFNVTHDISYDMINDVRKKLIEFNFIEKTTSASNFKSIFLHKLKTEKVDWMSKGTLKYFIQELIEKPIFVDEIKDKWIITSNCFLVKGEYIDSDKFRKTKATKLKKTRTKLDSILSIFEDAT
jgi:hypothetical protein